MTRNDDFIGQLEGYLEEYEGSTPLPDDVRDVIRAQLPSIQQRAAWWPAQRVESMNLMLRYGIAAAVIAVVAAIGFSLFNNVGEDTAPPAPSADEPATAPIPEALRHPFVGLPRELPGINTSGVDRFVITLDASTLVLNENLLSSTAATNGSSLLLVTAADSVSGCEVGDEGTYDYSVSPGGSILTIETGDDACAARAVALPGRWQRSECRNPANFCLGSLEAETYSSVFFEPRPIDGVAWRARFGAFTFSVPEGWAASDDWPEKYQLVPEEEYATFDRTTVCSDVCPDQISLWAAPRAAAESCADGALAPGVGGSAAELRDWILAHPGLVAGQPQAITLAGLSATAIDLEVSPDWTGTCDPNNPFVGVPLFVGEYHIAVAAGDRYRTRPRGPRR